ERSAAVMVATAAATVAAMTPASTRWERHCDRHSAPAKTRRYASRSLRLAWTVMPAGLCVPRSHQTCRDEPDARVLATPRTRRPGTGTTLRPVPSWLERVVSSTQRTAVSTAFDRGSGLLNFTPKDQIILLAGLEDD